MHDGLDAVLLLCYGCEIERPILGRSARAPCDSDGLRLELRETRYAREEVAETLGYLRQTR